MNLIPKIPYESFYDKDTIQGLSINFSQFIQVSIVFQGLSINFSQVSIDSNLIYFHCVIRVLLDKNSK